MKEYLSANVTFQLQFPFDFGILWWTIWDNMMCFVFFLSYFSPITIINEAIQYLVIYPHCFRRLNICTFQMRLIFPQCQLRGNVCVFVLRSIEYKWSLGPLRGNELPTQPHTVSEYDFASGVQMSPKMSSAWSAIWV